ncbi:MAG TPA: signal peptidase I [Candidatus Deferrimicrobiaceae bacterium]|nr:signal peptidase I [Candidatus Deferrimicrobiaceae bacterium]
MARKGRRGVAPGEPQASPGERAPDSPDRAGKEPPRKGKLREYIEAFAVALLIALVVRTFVIQAFKIPSGSMENTLLIGDHIFVNKFVYGYHLPFTKGRILAFGAPERGDIIVFVYPVDPDKDFIKRVIAVPGDTVEIREKAVFINGEPLREEYTRYADGNTVDGYVRNRDNMPAVKVPKGNYFVLGDNRDRSYDSRFWGFVEKDAIIGKALFIYFSVDWSADVRWFQVWRYPEFVRWGRIGDVLH